MACGEGQSGVADGKAARLNPDSVFAPKTVPPVVLWRFVLPALRRAAFRTLSGAAGTAFAPVITYQISKLPARQTDQTPRLW